MKYITLSLLFIILSPVLGQNIILNNGFEVLDSNKTHIMQRHAYYHALKKGKEQYWVLSSNFFNLNSNLNNITTYSLLFYDTILKNKKYYKPFNAYKGKSCLGLYTIGNKPNVKHNKTFFPNGHNEWYRSYATLKLSHKLIEGKYNISIAVKYSGYSRCVSSGLGAVLTYTVPNEMKLGAKHNMEHYDADAVFNNNKIIMPGDWQVFTTTIMADGGEEYITIGNFFPKKKLKTKVVNRKTNWRGSYYLIDEVRLEPTDSSQIIKPKFSKVIINQKPKAIDTLTFELFYEELESQADTAIILNKIKHLIQKDIVSITITGYADSKGDYSDNIVLANKRAINISSFFKGYFNTKAIHIRKCRVLPIDKLTNNKKVSIAIIYKK